VAVPLTIPARRVLLVEDQAAVRTLASATLEREGFDVLAVEASAKAISHFAGFDPDVLVADIDVNFAIVQFALAELFAHFLPRTLEAVIDRAPACLRQ
jgi:CheY-like chemotaxis protein